MSLLSRFRRAGAWLLCLALFVGPVGPGGAWHVANVDDLGATAGATSLSDPSRRPDGADHAGPSCLVCQSLNGARAVLPVGVALLHAAPLAEVVLPEAVCPRSRDGARTSPSRAPPLA